MKPTLPVAPANDTAVVPEAAAFMRDTRSGGAAEADEGTSEGTTDMPAATRARPTACGMGFNSCSSETDDGDAQAASGGRAVAPAG